MKLEEWNMKANLPKQQTKSSLSSRSWGIYALQVKLLCTPTPSTLGRNENQAAQHS